MIQEKNIKEVLDTELLYVNSVLTTEGHVNAEKLMVKDINYGVEELSAKKGHGGANDIQQKVNIQSEEKNNIVKVIIPGAKK
ncbi:hypothetical protein [Aliarcobacter cryaerophilus]|uniref:hypothetical protein n=1 Tax=Aliarcobacter cryaerophilus TaxID=28198 RepID=UPI00082B2E9E|nr:hypothetical protein [Aliarcobacter cryaerophilus]